MTNSDFQDYADASVYNDFRKETGFAGFESEMEFNIHQARLNGDFDPRIIAYREEKKRQETITDAVQYMINFHNMLDATLDNRRQRLTVFLNTLELNGIYGDGFGIVITNERGSVSMELAVDNKKPSDMVSSLYITKTLYAEHSKNINCQVMYCGRSVLEFTI